MGRTGYHKETMPNKGCVKIKNNSTAGLLCLRILVIKFPGNSPEQNSQENPHKKSMMCTNYAMYQII